MKTMKKLWISICSFLFMLALGLGITLNTNVKAKAATSADANITYACVEYSANDGTGVPTTYTFVAGLTTSAAYDTYVYIDGQKTAATVNWGNFYIDHSAFDCEVGDTFLLEIPAGTYYQTDAYLASDVNLFLTLTNSYTNPESGAYNKQGILTITDASNIISETPYSIQLNRASWAMNASNASHFYATIVDPDNTIKSGVQTEDWTNGAKYAPLGNAITVNGVAINKNIQKVYADPSENAYISLANVSNPGDVLTFDGWFYNATQGAFRIEKTSFIYDGKSWDEENSGTYDLEVSTTSDANPQNGFYLSMPANHIPVSTTDSGWSFSTVSVGTNHYGYHNSTAFQVKLRKFSTTDWYIALNESGITAVAGDMISLGGWFYCSEYETSVGSNGSTVYGDLIETHYIKINQCAYQFDGTKWTNITPTISVSLGGTAVENNTLYVAPGQSVSDVTATASNGNAVTMNFGEAASDSAFVLRSGESKSDYLATFSVTDSNGVVYTKKVAVCVGFEDFAMENGAAVRVDGENVNGLRFSAEMSVDTYNSLKAQDATFGIVIVPRDYITEGYELTAANLFGTNAKYSATAELGADQTVRRMLLLDNLTPSNRDNDSNYELYGAITDILTNNLTREFVGVAYAKVGGEYIVASYYGNDIENNARSIYYVAQKAVDANDNASKVQEKYIDTYNKLVSDAGKEYNVSYTVNHIKTRKGVMEVETETLTGVLNSTVEIAAKDYDGFALTSGVAGVTIKLYANKPNVVDFYYKDISLPDMDVTAWHHPQLDATDNYMNDTNKAIAETMRDAGFTSVMLNGSHTVGDLYLNSPANIETMKQIINMFWTYGGITTYVSGKNSGSTAEYVSLEDYQALETEMATLLDCEGFGGFFAWDEPLPNAVSMERIAEYAAWFDELYGDQATFMTNLFPSYYNNNDWSASEYTSYAAYIKAYCDIVLPNIVKGTKYLSVDTYPINNDGTLDQMFMYDMAVLKHYALEYDAQANAILQACGWSSDTHNVAPTEAQYRMMYYTALAFGMDSIGWWGYSPEKEDPTVILPGQTPVNIDGTTTAAYDAIKNVNTEVAAFGPIYKTYTWQGVIMSSPSAGFIGIGKDAQYDAFNKVKSDSLLSKYMLSASSTASFSSISGSGSNYVVSVMKDNNDNEAFTVVNYSAPTDNKTLSLTLKANAEGQYVIYKGGEQTKVTITTSGYTLTLAPGEGAFIMNANTTHSVTFKNWDGTTLYETTCQVGNTPVYNAAEPTRDGYTFAGWTPALGAITGDTVYTATFKGLPTITFKNWDGTVLQQGTWNYGATPVYSGATPTKDGCEFAGWTPAITTVTGDATYTATFNEFFTVTYNNWDGTTTPKTAKILSGSTISYTPTLDGYIFKGWLTEDGEAFDGVVTEDITLVATWYKVVEGADEVISAQTVLDGVQLESGYGYKEEEVTANPNASWYFDSDYNGTTGAGGTDDNKFANWVKFTLTYNGSNGTSDTGRETYLVLPAINYKLYSKVDFAYMNNGNIKALTIYGTEVGQFGGTNKLISIVTDENGTKLYFREINSVAGDVTSGADAVITLPESVANGSEGLRLNVTVGGWFKFAITEMHATIGASDYMTAMSEAEATLESNPADADALNKYLENEEYMTAYEKVGYTTPDAIISAQENNLYNAIVNATAGSEEQATAIEEYRAFIQEHDIRNSLHIAAINTIIYENFYELEEEQILLNDPTVDTTRGAVDQGERIQTGWGGHNTDYNTTYETYVHMIQFTSGDYDSTATLPAINYNSYAEAYFGLRAITGGNGTITIGNGSYSFDSSKNHNWKVTIVGNILTVSDDNKSNNDGGCVLWTTVLSDDVANGVTGLVIDFAFDAWSQAEITEMRVTAFTMSETTSDNVPSGWSTAGTRAANFTTAYTATKQKTFDSSNNYAADAVLPAFNYNAYDEVYFGLYAIAGARSWSPYDADNGIITINGVSYNGINPQNGDYYFKVTIKDGVLTMVVEKENNVTTGLVALTVALPEDVANGTAGLTISFTFGGAWSQAEITELHASSAVRKILSTVENNAVTMELSGTTVGTALRYDASTYWGTGAHTAFNTSYTSQNLVSFNAADSAYTATFTLPKFAFADYKEAYFGFTAATAAGNTTVTVGGQSYTYNANDGYRYVKMLIKDGVLTVIGDGANNAGTVYMSATLSEAVLNGSEALTITWSTAGWSRVEITEIQTNTWVDPLS